MGKKDKRKKGSDHPKEARSAEEKEARSAEEKEARSVDEPSPTTRRSPVPDAGPASDINIPTSRVPTLVPPSDDLESETTGDVAPVGPTELAGAGAPGDVEEVDTPPVSTPGVAELEQQIRDLEARLDAMIGKPRDASPAAEPRAPAAPALGGEGGHSTARELLSSDFYLRQWGRTGMRSRAEEVDEFGQDPKYEARYRPFFDFLHRYYFRTETEGTEHIPSEGRCLLVSNHSGGPLPYDGLMLRTAVRREHPDAREVRWLTEDFICYLPFVGAMMNRLGAVRACQENAERLLAGGRLVAVFPEGAKGIGKLFRDRYRLQRFGRGGFIRLCLRTRTPIVPCAIVGAEEANPMLYRVESLAKSFGLPYVPITPTFPALGPLGLLPAPTKWRITFGEPMSFEGYGAEAADDEILVGRLAERVRTTIQAMLDRTLEGRRSIWFG
jgi:1-acyl-sn-glycerol-3-phosphate acyltransferase